MPIHAGCLLLGVVVVGAYIGLVHLISMHPPRKAVNCTWGYWKTNTNFLLGGTRIFAYILGISC